MQNWILHALHPDDQAQTYFTIRHWLRTHFSANINISKEHSQDIVQILDIIAELSGSTHHEDILYGEFIMRVAAEEFERNSLKAALDAIEEIHPIVLAQSLQRIEIGLPFRNAVNPELVRSLLRYATIQACGTFNLNSLGYTLLQAVEINPEALRTELGNTYFWEYFQGRVEGLRIEEASVEQLRALTTFICF
ncbi:MAG TPA: hypothetical protein PLV25_05290, partial [Opitutales bacterium]|nr:hypothetical protein [Opitutales bacterium]